MAWVLGAISVLARLWLAAEAASALGLWLLRVTTGVYYAPRDRLTLSSKCRAFIERLIAENGKGETLELSATLGWTLRPGATSRDGLIHVNAQGLRGTRDYGRVTAPGKLRVAVFGDCLTLGGGVPDDRSWPREMEQLDPRLEVLNFGVDGYGPDQMLLRYFESEALCAGSDSVVLALASSNVYKTLNAFRPFYAYDHGLQLAKPRFALRAGELELIPNPLPGPADYRALLDHPESVLARLGSLDEFRRNAFLSGPSDWLPSVRLAKTVSSELRKRRAVRDRSGDYVPDSAALRLTTAIVDAFCERARKGGAHPVIALLPLASDVRRYARAGVRTYQPLIRHCLERKHAVVDGLDAFLPHARRGDSRELFDGIHYTPLANRLVASALVGEMRSRSSR